MNFIKPFWEKHIKRIESEWKETDIFLIVFEKYNHFSCLTWKEYLKENLQARQFAHILPKWYFPDLRLNPDNIIFVDDEKQHERVDQTVNRIWKSVFLWYVESWIAVEILQNERNKDLKPSKNNMQKKAKVKICDKCGRWIPTRANYCPHCKDIDDKNKIDPKGAQFAEFMQKQYWVKFIDSWNKDDQNNIKLKNSKQKKQENMDMKKANKFKRLQTTRNKSNKKSHETNKAIKTKRRTAHKI